MAYFLSPALVRLRGEINTLWPGRDRSSDGWIGDTAHSARRSDHNPDYAAGGIVRAIDVDKDGIPVESVVAQIIRDPRVAYVIWNARIWENPAAYPLRGYWRAYTGTNAHRLHVHVSVRHGTRWDRDARSWGITASTSSGGGRTLPPTAPATSPIAPVTPLEEDDDMTLLVTSPSYGTALLAGGRLVGIGDQSSVDGLRSGGKVDTAPISDADFQRLAAVTVPGVLYYNAPQHGGRGWAYSSPSGVAGIGDQGLVDELRARGVPVVEVKNVGDFDRLTA